MGYNATETLIVFFEDSVVRDEDGEPVVVYHGTKNRFNKFDNAKLMSGTNAANTGLGLFFLTSQRLQISLLVKACVKNFSVVVVANKV